MRALVGHDDVGERVVQRLALGVQALKAPRSAASGRPLPRQRAQAVSTSTSIHTTSCRASASRTAAEPTAPPPSARTRVRGVAEQLERDALLGRPERGLSVRGEHLGDRLAEPLVDHLVDVDRDRAERLRRGPGGGRLAGAHEPDHRHDPAIAVWHCDAL